jgi:ferric-dicitrate binding protein FerR (iron transport regulator)
MSAGTDRQLSTADQALRWFARLRSGDATVADQQQFQSWVRLDLSHQQEFDKVFRLWADLGEAKLLLVDELNRIVADGKPDVHRSRRGDPSHGRPQFGSQGDGGGVISSDSLRGVNNMLCQ